MSGISDNDLLFNKAAQIQRLIKESAAT